MAPLEACNKYESCALAGCRTKENKLHARIVAQAKTTKHNRQQPSMILETADA